METLKINLTQDEMNQLILVVNESPVARRITDPLMVKFDQAIQEFQAGKISDLTDDQSNGVKDTKTTKKVPEK